MNLKHNYPIAVFLAAFGIAVFFSFKHQRPPETTDNASASPQERIDQLTLSSMHAEPAPLSSAPPSQQAAGIQASAVDLAQLHALDEILAAKSDNDPRLDNDLRFLSSAAKALMRARYGALSPEKRNGRGTIVFLVGRELSSADDVSFLHNVLNEPPCRSLASCDREETGSVSPEDRHHEGTNEVTLAYPQIVALKSLESYLNQGGAFSPQVLAELETARRSPIRKVASLADEISQEYHRKHP